MKRHLASGHALNNSGLCRCFVVDDPQHPPDPGSRHLVAPSPAAAIWWSTLSYRKRMSFLSPQRKPLGDTYWREIAAYAVHQAGGLVGVTMMNSIVFILFFIGASTPSPSFHGTLNSPASFGCFWLAIRAGFGWGEKASLVTLGFLGFSFHRSIQGLGTVLAAHASLANPFIAWANMHRGFILGLLIFALYTCDAGIRDRRLGLRLGLWWSACAAATLINPYGVGVYGMSLKDFSLSL